MHWSSVVEWGMALGVAWGASRKMDEFKAMFQKTLDRLAQTSESHGKEIAELKSQVAETNQAVAGLAGVVASAIFEDDDGDGDPEPGPIN